MITRFDCFLVEWSVVFFHFHQDYRLCDLQWAELLVVIFPFFQGSHVLSRQVCISCLASTSTYQCEFHKHSEICWFFNASVLFCYFANKLLAFKQGAKQLYMNHLRPFLLKHQESLDRVLGLAYCEVVCPILFIFFFKL